MIKILDCTLRDGGYYTNWDFKECIVDAYVQSMNELPIEYIELGYRSKPLNGYLGEYFYTPKYIIDSIREKSNKKISILIDEKNHVIEDLDFLIDPCISSIDLVRIAINPKNLDRAVSLAKAIKNKGVEVAFNVMYMSTWKDISGFYDKLKRINGIVDYFYMVDSYGSVFPKDVIEIIQSVKDNCNVKLGFHGHNNLELALVNTLTAIENGVDIVDSTITGMGRGAGNLKTELILTVLAKNEGIEVNYNALSNVVDEFEGLKEELKWGTILPYMVSGANSLPQKEVMEWVSKRAYSLNSIIRALENQSKGSVDNEKLPILKKENKYKKAIVIGGGASAVNHKRAILKYLSSCEDTCIIHASSKNAAHYSEVPLNQYFCLVGNEGYRMERVLLGNFGKNVNCILPPYPRKMGTYIPIAAKKKSKELLEVNWIKMNKDSHTVLALESAVCLGVEMIELVGYDGYESHSITSIEQQLTSENEYAFDQFSNFFRTVSLKSLLPSNYKNIELDSVYKYI